MMIEAIDAIDRFNKEALPRKERLMTKDQTIGSADRIAAVLATWFLGWLVNKGYISTADSAAFLPIIIALPAAIWGFWNNRQAAIIASASALPEVSSITVNTQALGDVAKAADPNTNVQVKA